MCIIWIREKFRFYSYMIPKYLQRAVLNFSTRVGPVGMVIIFKVSVACWWHWGVGGQWDFVCFSERIKTFVSRQLQIQISNITVEEVMRLVVLMNVCWRVTPLNNTGSVAKKLCRVNCLLPYKTWRGVWPKKEFHQHYELLIYLSTAEGFLIYKW